MKNIILSIVIPVYNVKEYLDDCLNNILDASENRYEVILVDDGSTDGSAEVCDYYEKNNSNVKVFHKENGGLSSARNVGIKYSKGKYICFIDSDDVVASSYVDSIIEYISKLSDTDIFIYKYDTFFTRPKNVRQKEIKFKKISKQKAMSFLPQDFCGNYAWNKVCKRSVIGDIRYPVGKAYEDIFTTYKFFDRAKTFVFIEDTMYFYRQRNQSIVHQNPDKSVKFLVDSIEARLLQLDYFKKKKFTQAVPFATSGLIENYVSYLNLKRNLRENKLSEMAKKQISEYHPSLRYDGSKKWVKINLYKLSPNLYSWAMKIKNM